MSDDSRHEVIMPALGMTQDTGEIVSWQVALGAVVKADDILYEVETDKTTMEVEAGFSGVIVDIRAAAGEAVPVGSVIAVIDSASSSAITTAPDSDKKAGSSVSGGQLPAAGSIVSDEQSPTAESIVSDEQSPAAGSIVNDEPSPTAGSKLSSVQPGHAKNIPGRNRAGAKPVTQATQLPDADCSRILASPKAKLAARDKGLTLEQLVKTGISEPIQYLDVQQYVPAANSIATAQSLLQARVKCAAYQDFLAWAEQQSDTLALTGVSGTAWSLFASSAWRHCGAEQPLAEVVVLVEQWSNRELDLLTINADKVGLLDIVALESAGPVDLVVRDMTSTSLIHYQSGDEQASPSLTVVEDTDEYLLLSLRFDESGLPLDTAMALLNRVSQLVEQPLRHLL